MKSVLRIRLVWIALLLSASLFTACKKENVDPVEPGDFGNQAKGKYTYSELSVNGQTRPAKETNLTGTITVNRQSATLVSMDLDIRQKSTDDDFMVMSVEDVEVEDEGNGTLAFVYDGEKIGTLKGKKLIINGEDSSNVRFTIGATK
jgi:hypothetical protein